MLRKAHARGECGVADVVKGFGGAANQTRTIRQSAQAAGYLDAVDAGQVIVEDHCIEAGAGAGGEVCGAVVGRGDGVAETAEGFGQEFAGCGVVLDDQNDA